MASPPSSLPTISLPRKRPSIITSVNNQSTKRHKPSPFRAPSALRQTSFPPEDSDSLAPNSALSPPTSARSPPARTPGARSPSARSRELSVDSNVNGGVATPSVRSGRGGRGGRKGKGALDDGKSDRGSTRRGATGDEGKEDVEESEEEDDLEDGVTGDLSTEAEKEFRSQAAAVLASIYQAYPDTHQHRFGAWKSANVKKDMVKKLINYTLSQSIPNSVQVATSAALRVFISSLVDTACQIRKENVLASGKTPLGETLPDDMPAAERTKPEYLGPLTPDHLREALRRYKKERDGGLPGHMGMSLSGMQNTAPKTYGKRLFR